VHEKRPSRANILCDLTMAAMNLWPPLTPIRIVLREPKPASSSSPIRQAHPCQVWNESRPRSPGRHSDKPSWPLGLAHLLAALILTALNPSAKGESSVTLAWNPSPGSDIAGYRLYQGSASRIYTNVLDVRIAINGTFSALASGVTYFFAATAYNTNGLESDYSSEVSYTAPLTTNNPPSIALTSPANGAVYAAPATIPLAASVTANSHTISQVQFYNGAKLLGTVTPAPYSFTWYDVSPGTYSLSATAVYDSGSTVVAAAANVTVTATKPPSGLTFAADSGAISSPFIATNGTIRQPMATTLASSGRATYSFNIINAGDYLVSAMVSAANEGQNSFYVSIDAEPTDPLMIWDVPVTTGLTSHTVSWRGNGAADPSSAQYSPKVFTLSAGAHQLIYRGREANTTLGTISIMPTSPTLQIRTAAGDSVVLSVTGQPGQRYDVMSSQGFTAWTLIGTVTLDANGSCEFTNSACSSRPNRMYRLQAQ
jgi:hypothetical protein